tara:strand:+ start:119 stop:538 length:420 start_codon:yes stop_codon:yes gene_type:complete
MNKTSSNVTEVLKDDGVESVDIANFENLSNINIKELVKKFGKDKSWAVRVTFNKRFGGVAIQQLPGEGNRLHQHPDAAECWVILKGKWKWFIEGKGDMEVSEGSIINVPAKTNHQITCIGDEPGIRFAVTKPDVEHIYK